MKDSASQLNDQYRSLSAQVSGLIAGESDWIANTANVSALLFMSLEQINWAGFYFYKDDQLVLGPFQGKPACIRIPMGKGVCGTAAATGEIQLVDDVHQFEGHIACDAASNSEIVIPLFKEGKLLGVLDIDSPITHRFTQQDAVGLAHISQLLIDTLP